MHQPIKDIIPICFSKKKHPSFRCKVLKTNKTLNFDKKNFLVRKIRWCFQGAFADCSMRGQQGGKLVKKVSARQGQMLMRKPKCVNLQHKSVSTPSFLILCQNNIYCCSSRKKYTDKILIIFRKFEFFQLLQVATLNITCMKSGPCWKNKIRC